MFRELGKRAKGPSRVFFRMRHCKPLCPLPTDYSKVEKVTILGASSLLGQHLAFLLKRADIIRNLALHDDINVRGIALDLEHMNTKSKVRPNSGDYSIKSALKFSDIIVITNGFDLDGEKDENVERNGSLIYKYGIKIANTCPEALVCIVTPPINVMVPLFSEAMKVCDAYNPNKIFGICSTGEMRASSIVAEYLGLDPSAVKVPIVGGATPSTMVPLLSQTEPYNEFSDVEMKKLITAISEVPQECKKLHTTAPLSTAYAVSRFVLTLCAGLCTCECAVQTAFVRSNAVSQVQYFASAVRSSTEGAVENYGLPKIHEYELQLLSQALMLIERDYCKALSLFKKMHQEARKEEIAELCKPNKPFLIKTPVPPCPACFPSDVCQEKLPENPCAPAVPSNTTPQVPCVC